MVRTLVCTLGGQSNRKSIDLFTLSASHQLCSPAGLAELEPSCRADLFRCEGVPPTGLGLLAAPRLSFGGLGIGNECAHHAPTPATRGADVGLPGTAMRSHVKSIQVKSSENFATSESIKSSQISTTDRTHARTGPETQRAQAHNHTQNSHPRTQPDVGTPSQYHPKQVT